jgi:hypothetical protein
MIEQGVRWVITILALIISITALADIYFEWRHWRSVTTRLHTWARNYPYYALALVFLLGAVIAHFFLNSNA